ncbi:MAG: TetR/AcrR family transcriptional regulator [Acidimicrobiales bacterium]|jgi:AcrR family transcriptional regulator|nr:TetR/AcrR family transcriptional regulator [Acidimicrobiales bacterium]
MRGAAAVFAERGFDGTTMEALREVTGVPTSTLYYYFEGKEQVLTFLLEDWLDRTAAAAAEAIATERTAKERLGDLVAAQLTAMANDPATCQVLLAELGRIDRLPHIAEAVQSAFHRPVAKLLADGAADRHLRSVDVDVATSVLYGAVIISGLHHIIDARDEVPAFDATEVAASVMDLVLHGLESEE